MDLHRGGQLSALHLVWHPAYDDSGRNVGGARRYWRLHLARYPRRHLLQALGARDRKRCRFASFET
jgi:hypothetical protein